MDNGNEPAYPTLMNGHDCHGLTKREEFAKEMLQGMMDAYCRTEIDDMNEARYAQMAVRMADALLAELAKEQSK